MDEIQYTKKVKPEDDDIPYEVRMKHIIEAYRKDLKRLESLEKYAKGLEEENLQLQKKMEKTDAWLAEEPDRQAAIQKMQLEIKQLRGTLIKSFPKRVIQMRDIKKKVMSLEEYIRYLQRLLQQNDIPYEERKVNPSKSESIDFDSLDIFAVEPLKLIIIKYSRRLAYSVNAESLFKLFESKNLLIIFRAPAEQCNIIYDSLGQITLLNQILKAC